MNEKVNNCLKTIDKLFKWLSLTGIGFLGLIGIFTFVKNLFGMYIAKIALIVLAILMIGISYMIYDRFVIIKEINLKDEI